MITTPSADVRTLAEAAPISFLLGLFVGFWLSSFYRIVRRQAPARHDVGNGRDTDTHGADR